MTPQGLFRAGCFRFDTKDCAAHLVFAEAIRTGVQETEVDREVLFVVGREGVRGRSFTGKCSITFGHWSDPCSQKTYTLHIILSQNGIILNWDYSVTG